MENKTKRRRSFVDMKRKSLVFDSIFNEGNKSSSDNEVDNFTIDKYLSALKGENMQWKSILKAKTREVKEHKLFCSFNTLEITPSEVEQYLNEEDRKFLSDKPNYLNMMESASKYLNAINFLKRYRSDVIGYYDKLVDNIEVETYNLIEYLCQSNACELCNHVDCTEIDHKFPTK